MRDFFTLSIHQRIEFIHNVCLRVKPDVPRRTKHFFGQNIADYGEIIMESDFYRGLRYTQSEYNQQKMSMIYRRLDPVDKIQLPAKLRCRSVIIMIFADFFNLFQIRLTEKRILKAIEIALFKLGTINEAEASKIPEIYQFREDNKTISFFFQEKRYLCQLNPNSVLGFDLTLLPDVSDVPPSA